MNLQELKNADYQLPVHERLLLVESIISQCTLILLKSI